jgi:hypothetical protein
MRDPALIREAGDLPASIPVFPLSRAIVLPRARLPLNIFEPRYLAMVNDALAGQRVIGMVQPTEPENLVPKPGLCPVGCLGRLVAFSETGDGRYLISLLGMCRFEIAEELTVTTPYRQTRVSYDRFAGDFIAPADAETTVDRPRLMAALGAFASHRHLQADWSTLEKAGPEMLVNWLAMICPFDVREKQALLEAHDLAERAELLTGLLEIAAADTTGQGGSIQ